MIIRWCDNGRYVAAVPQHCAAFTQMSLRIATIAVAFLSAWSRAGAVQAVFSTTADPGQPFAPVGTLDVLSETSFTALTHPEFPNYGVRIKKSNFCDEGVKCVQR